MSLDALKDRINRLQSEYIPTTMDEVEAAFNELVVTPNVNLTTPSNAYEFVFWASSVKSDVIISYLASHEEVIVAAGRHIQQSKQSYGNSRVLYQVARLGNEMLVAKLLPYNSDYYKDIALYEAARYWHVSEVEQH